MKKEIKIKLSETLVCNLNPFPELHIVIFYEEIPKSNTITFILNTTPTKMYHKVDQFCT